MENSYSPLLLLLIVLLNRVVAGFVTGSCSRSCLQDSKRLLEFDIPLHKCYCSSGCAKLGDCCHDSEHRGRGPLLPKSQEMCFGVVGKGDFRAISECPEGSCFDASLPPVTSLVTNLTYANKECAACHHDTDELVNWKAELKCCKDNLKGIRLRTHIKKGYKAIFQRRRRYCSSPCNYTMTDGAFQAVSHLDLRPCRGSNSEVVSKCDFGGDEESPCDSYEDPVYADSKLYLNIDCAKCNGARAEDATCVPEPLRDNSTAALLNCQEKGVVACFDSFEPIQRKSSLSIVFGRKDTRKKMCEFGKSVRACEKISTKD